jgi:pilus assembly protein Flp/PilA
VICSLFAREEGQGLVEYGLILVLLAIVVIGVLSLIGLQASQVLENVNSGMGSTN